MTAKVKQGSHNLKIKDAIALISKLDLPQKDSLIEQMEKCNKQYDCIKFYNNDIKINGDLQIDSPWIINGDLHVGNHLDDTGNNLNNIIFVFGNVYCNNLISRSNMVIMGELKVKNCTVLDSMGNHLLYIKKDFSSKIVIGLGHQFEVDGKIDKDTVFFGDIDAIQQISVENTESLAKELLDSHKSFLPKLIGELVY